MAAVSRKLKSLLVFVKQVLRLHRLVVDAHVIDHAL
jgi:hypothetical protein